MRIPLLALGLTLGASFIASAGPVESQVETQGPRGPLRGTMLKPDTSQRPPIALIVPGSGPTDRDGNNPLGVKAATYRLLAEGLAAQGIATVRTDKRGLGGSKDAVLDPNDVSIRAYAGDTLNWVAEIRRETGAACVWIVGHSEGGLIALAAARHASDVCGVVLLATPGRPLAEALREQLRNNPANAPILDQAEGVIDDLDAGKTVDVSNLPPAVATLFAPQLQRFWIDLFAHDPARMMSDYRGPALIVQGERDLQVSTEDAYSLKEANAQAALRLLPDVNHVLKTVATDDPAANAATYADPTLPLAPDVVPAVADFILSEGVEQ
ncbi:alpha/beta fold hydrolase [Corticibacterium sp. UT-5YL-CI-8]|nr:alpha/beta fold hydrolase [Tianweitania sp. UT-5YL-CI-8]